MGVICHLQQPTRQWPRGAKKDDTYLSERRLSQDSLRRPGYDHSVIYDKDFGKPITSDPTTATKVSRGYNGIAGGTITVTCCCVYKSSTDRVHYLTK